MNETSKTLTLLGPQEKALLTGQGIDVGCGPDPISPNARRFDVEDGDANEITKYVKEQFDFVYSSHCLEHMKNPRAALLDWWKLVKPGGHLIFMVPDEDLYEQGVFPSRFNSDHKATFTISKAQSWSPVSVNVLDLALSLPNSQLVKLTLQDQGYDRRLIRHGAPSRNPVAMFLNWLNNGLYFHRKIQIIFFPRLWSRYIAIDQLTNPNIVAQIQCIVKKLA